MATDRVERFWSKVEQAGEDDCWIWKAEVDRAAARALIDDGWTLDAKATAWANEETTPP